MSISPVPSYVNKQGGFNVIPLDIIEGNGAPSASLKRPVGYFYYDTVGQALYGSGGVVNGSGVWIALGGGSVAVSAVNGTANQITSANVAGVVTLSLPATVQAPGSVTATTTLTATLGAITATNGNLVLGTAGNKLSIATGANASVGTATLVAGTKTVSTTAVTASSKIFVTVGTLGTVAAPQAMYVDAIVAGTSFDITSADGTDTSDVNWWIIN
jgi:hypothetical protein